MTTKERIDKRAKEMHAPILKEVRRLEAEIRFYQTWVEVARVAGIETADNTTQNVLNWKP